VDVIMLDNMSTEDMKQAVKLIAGQCRRKRAEELRRLPLRAVAECGVDYISVGALTHSVKSLDLSFESGGHEKN